MGGFCVGKKMRTLRGEIRTREREQANTNEQDERGGEHNAGRV